VIETLSHSHTLGESKHKHKGSSWPTSCLIHLR
jgi:hypothetical protein